MQRTLVIIGIVVLLVLPIVLLAFRHPAISTQVQKILRVTTNNQVSDQYVAASEAPGRTLKIVDTAYLEFVAANLGIFKDKAIVDPQLYRGKTDATQKYTVSHVRFVLVPDVEAFVYGSSGKEAFASKGGYRIDGDTLEVLISLNADEIRRGAFNTQFPFEEAFLKTAGVTLLYAHGVSDPMETAKMLEKLKNDMKEYLYTGIFAWPIRIDEQ